MTHADMIYGLDLKYRPSRPPFDENPDAVPCPNEGKKVNFQSGWSSSSHGSMAVHQSGVFLICGLCGAKQPTAMVN